MTMISATMLADAEWVRGDLATARRQHGGAEPRVLGTVRWYSISSVLVAAPLESLVRTGVGLDPSLRAITVEVLPDGRVPQAYSSAALSGDLAELGAAMGSALGAAIDTFAEVSGAARPALWAIAGDSISNRLLWAGRAVGEVDRATGLAQPLAAAIGSLPQPRYVRVAGNTIVRRTSCCLIYEATGMDKCVSCPHQPPQQRERRLRAQFDAPLA